jgi:hypothetical protein
MFTVSDTDFFCYVFIDYFVCAFIYIAMDLKDDHIGEWYRVPPWYH